MRDRLRVSEEIRGHATPNGVNVPVPRRFLLGREVKHGGWAPIVLLVSSFGLRTTQPRSRMSRERKSVSKPDESIRVCSFDVLREARSYTNPGRGSARRAVELVAGGCGSPARAFVSCISVGLVDGAAEPAFAPRPQTWQSKQAVGTARTRTSSGVRRVWGRTQRVPL